MKTFLFVIALAVAVPALAQTQFAVTRDVVAGGGAVGASVHFNLGGTVGEPVPSSTDTNNQFTVRSGFWIQPAPVVFAPRSINGNFLFSFETEPGQTYMAQFASSLSNPSWQNLLVVGGDGTIKTATNSTPNTDLRFYRLVQQ